MALVKKYSPRWNQVSRGLNLMNVMDSYSHLLDPILLLFYSGFRLPEGFDEHPHRGFQTISYITEGCMYHEDSKGHKGKLNAGDCLLYTSDAADE